MTNTQGNSVGVASILILIIVIILLSSCGSMRLTQEQQMERAVITKEMDKLWYEYSYKIDSLIIEYDNVKK